MIDFGCPKCGTMQQAADSAAGQKVPCAKCGQRLLVPVPAAMQTVSAVVAPQPPAAAGGEKSWFYELDGKPCGPVTAVELKRLVAGRKVGAEDRVWAEGMTEWKPIKTIPDLRLGPAKAPRVTVGGGGGSGRWVHKRGLLVFAALAGVAILVCPGFLVWKGTKRAAAPGEEGEKEQRSSLKDGPLDGKEVFERCSPAVAQVLTRTGSGSGFLARQGMVVTNFHVVEDDLMGNIQVAFPSSPRWNQPVKAALLHEDRKRDLAILRVATSLPPLPLAERECAPLENVIVIGSPGTLPGQTVKNVPTAGNWSARTQLGDNQDWYQFTAPINPGNSGSPVFNSRGQVIGVVTMFLRDKQGMNYAVPYDELVRALDRASTKDQRDLDRAAAQHDAALAFRKVGKASCLYLLAMQVYHKVMKEAVDKGEPANVGLKRASQAIDRSIHLGAENFLDREMRAALVGVVSNEALPADTRSALEALVALHAEIKDGFDKPRGTLGSYRKTIDDCDETLKRLFQSLRLKLGVNEDPRPTREELKAIGLLN
jgi:S1-C subfamily serine protease/ribosomal protein S27E